MFLSSTVTQNNIKIWRNIRNTISPDFSLEDIVALFDTPPSKTRYIDYYCPENWPNVFDIVADGMNCQSSISIIIAATLVDAGFIKTSKIQFDVVSSHNVASEGLLLKLPEGYCNFTPGKIHSAEYVKQNASIYDSHIIAVDKLFD